MPLTHVPYKGGGPALIDLIAGDLQLMFSTYVVALPHVKSGRLRAIAVTTAQRQALLPDLPAVAESVPGFGVSNWNGIFAPAKLPPAVRDRLFAEITKAARAPEAVRRLNNTAIDAVVSASPADFVKFIREDMQKWQKVVADVGIRLE